MMKHDLCIIINGEAYHVLKITMARRKDKVSQNAAKARIRKFAVKDIAPDSFYVIVKGVKKSLYYYICEKLNLEECVEDA